MPDSSSDLLEVGRIGKPHGVKGDLFVSFTSDRAQRRQVGTTLTLRDASGTRTLTIVTIRAQADRFVVHFEGIDDRNAAEHLTNKFLLAEPIEDDDALWVHELMGSTVVDLVGTAWGTVVGVVHNPAHDILEISNGTLVPVPFVVSCANGVTTIDPPEGLLDLES